MKKWILILIISIISVFLLSLTPSSSDIFASSDIKVEIDGTDYYFSPPPIIKDGRTLVPMRALFEALGAEVEWISETRTAVGRREGIEVRIPVGSRYPIVNDTPVEIDVPALIIGNRTYLPLRFVGEALGDKIVWDNAQRKVIVERKGPEQPKETLSVHFIDVGQGDSILIKSDNVVILIDGGPRSAGEKIVSYLKKAGISGIDLIIATHPHEDHIGGLIRVMEEFPVKEVMDPAVVHTTKTFENYLKTIDRKNIKFTEARAGTQRTYKNVKLEILHPASPSSSHLNNASVVAKLAFGSVSFLFTGDAEKEAEQEMLSRKESLKADILKVSHHGSRTSTTEEFLRAVSPKTAVIMCGAGNRYGHPHKETPEKLEKAGVKVYRTDLHGDIIITTDGDRFNIKKGQGNHESRN